MSTSASRSATVTKSPGLFSITSCPANARNRGVIASAAARCSRSSTSVVSTGSNLVRPSRRISPDPSSGRATHRALRACLPERGRLWTYSYPGAMELEFTAAIVEWRGPSPYYFVPLPPAEAGVVDDVKAAIVYWGVVPVTAGLGDTEFTTAMFPREGTYFLPLKDKVR